VRSCILLRFGFRGLFAVDERVIGSLVDADDVARFLDISLAVERLIATTAPLFSTACPAAVHHATEMAEDSLQGSPTSARWPQPFTSLSGKSITLSFAKGVADHDIFDGEPPHHSITTWSPFRARQP